MIIHGIDPGIGGGLATIMIGDSIKVAADPMPVKAGAVDWATLAAMLREHDAADTVAVVEKCHAMPGQGVCSMFRFGGACEGVVAVLAAFGISTVMVTPQRWKGVILDGTERDKAAAVNYCRLRWPSLSIVPKGKRKPHDGMADALCIADYGLRMFGRVGEKRGA